MSRWYLTESSSLITNQVTETSKCLHTKFEPKMCSKHDKWNSLQECSLSAGSLYIDLKVWIMTRHLDVTCCHKMSVKSPVCTHRYSLLNTSQNKRKQRKIYTKYWVLLGKTRSYTHVLYIILKLVLWRIWICDNVELQLLLLYAHFVIAGHKCSNESFFTVNCEIRHHLLFSS